MISQSIWQVGLILVLGPCLTSSVKIGVGPAQEATSPRASIQHETLPAALRTTIAGERHAVRQVGRTLVSTAPGYEARFDADGFTFLPKRADALEAAPWQYRLEGVRVGEATLFAEDEHPRAVPSGAGTNRVEYARSSLVTERYDLLDEGVEQSFGLREHAGSGDLVIRGRVGGPLAPLPRPPGLAAPIPYGADNGTTVTYGVVTVFDAVGRTAGAAVAAFDNTLEIRVGGTWLADAQYPVIIDPLVSAAFVVTETSRSERRPAIAHDIKRNRYLVVWDEEEIEGTEVPRNVRGFIVRADGTRTGSRIDIATTAADDLAPDVAYNSATDEYLVVFERIVSPSNHDILAARIDAATLAVGPAIDVAVNSASPSDPIVVANLLPGQTNRWFIAWEDDRDAGGDVWRHIYGRFFDATGNPGTPMTDLLVSHSPGNLDDRHVRAAFNPSTGSYLAVYSSTDATDTDVAAVRVDGQTGGVTLVSAALSECGSCDVATEPDVAYNVWTGTALASWRDNRGAGVEVDSIYGRRLSDAGPIGVEFEIESGTATNPAREPSVSAQFAGGWDLFFVRICCGVTDFDIYGSWIAADGSVGESFFHRIADDDHIPDTIASATYGSHHTVFEHSFKTSDQDILGIRTSGTTFPVRTARANFDGLGAVDRTVVRLNTNGTLTWFVNTSAGGGTATIWGDVGDVPAAGDYDGDGKADVAVWRPENGGWFIVQSATGTGLGLAFGAGAEGDIPVPADYDGDGKTDLAVYRPGTTGVFFVVWSSTGAGMAVPWGTWGDIPVVADYDGDGKADVAVWRPSIATFFVVPSSGGSAYAQPWGAPGDQPVVGDFDGDGIDDVAVFRALATPTAHSQWLIIRSSTGSATATEWGLLGDLPVPGDYDGDGITDLAVWRHGSSASFLVKRSSGGEIGFPWGTAFDLPIAR